MTRITYAAKTLVNQILERWEDAQIQNDDEPDGLGIHRALRVEAPTGEQVLEALTAGGDVDQRIVAMQLDDEGDLHIQFSVHAIADTRDTFTLSAAQADEVAPSGDDSPPVEEKSTPPTKKAPAAKKGGK